MSIMTCPMSWLKGAVLPRWEVACTVRYWWRNNVLSNRLFFWWERAKAEAQNTPRRRNRRCRACQEGSWEGGGGLVGVYNSVVPCGGHNVSRWKLHHCVVQFTVF